MPEISLSSAVWELLGPCPWAEEVMSTGLWGVEPQLGLGFGVVVPELPVPVHWRDLERGI